jgi:hypothetical protein
MGASLSEDGLAVAGVSFRGTVYGDFDVRVRYELLQPLEGIGDEPFAGIILGISLFNDSFFVARSLNNEDESPDFGKDAYVAGIEDEIPVFTEDRTGLFRFTRQGNLMSAYYWGPSDPDWQLLAQGIGHSDPIPFLAFGVGNETPGTVVLAAFDDFSLTADQLNAIPEPASILFLGTGLAAIGLATKLRMK